MTNHSPCAWIYADADGGWIHRSAVDARAAVSNGSASWVGPHGLRRRGPTGHVVIHVVGHGRRQTSWTTACRLIALGKATPIQSDTADGGQVGESLTAIPETVEVLDGALAVQLIEG